MNAKELRRGEVLSRVKRGELKLTEAAELLEVSYRQAKRLKKRYGEEGRKLWCMAMWAACRTGPSRRKFASECCNWCARSIRASRTSALGRPWRRNIWRPITVSKCRAKPCGAEDDRVAPVALSVTKPPIATTGSTVLRFSDAQAMDAR